MVSEEARPAFWEGPALLFDGKSARARETRVAIGPDGLDVLEGEAAGRYGKGRLALIEKSEDDTFFSLALTGTGDAGGGHVLEFRDAAALEWLRSAGLLRRPAFGGLSLAGKAGILILILAAFTAFMYLAGLDLMVDATLKALPRRADRLLGDAVIKGFDDSLLAPRDEAARRALDKSRRMVQALDSPSRDSIRILVVADSSVKNAFAFPGGHIVVYTGMLRMLATQEEWTGLLAHEGGHIHLRHGMRQVVRAGILAVTTSLVFGDVSGLGSVLLDNAGTLVSLRYGRSAESEADAFALRRLQAAGYSAAGLVTLFEKFLKLQSMPAWATFLSTHPATRDRIEDLKGAREGPKGALLTPEEWAALRKL